MDNVIYAMLDKHCICSCHIHLDWETSLPLKPISRIGNAVILPQNPCSADCPSDYGYISSILLPEFYCQIIRPGLGCDGISIAYKSMIFFLSKHINCVKKIKPVCIPCVIIRKLICKRVISVGIITLGKRSCYENSGIHLGCLSQIYADVYIGASLDIKRDFIACDLSARLDCDRWFSIKSNRCLFCIALS